MASGFIVLTDGRVFSRRYTIYDKIIHAVINNLNDEFLEEKLKGWLVLNVPSIESEDYVEMGWGFVKNNNCISRYIDLRCFRGVYRNLFLDKILETEKYEINSKNLPSQVLESFSDLTKMIKLTTEGKPVEDFTDASFIKQKNHQQGPGW